MTLAYSFKLYTYKNFIISSLGVTELLFFVNKYYKSPPCTRVPILHNLNACRLLVLSRSIVRNMHYKINCRCYMIFNLNCIDQANSRYRFYCRCIIWFTKPLQRVVPRQIQMQLCIVRKLHMLQVLPKFEKLYNVLGAYYLTVYAV